MEEKDRYEVISPSLNGYAYIHDFKTDNVLNTYDSCDLLSQQDKRIKELEEELDDAKRDYIPKLEFGLQRANKMGRDAEKEIQQLKQQLALTEKALDYAIFELDFARNHSQSTNSETIERIDKLRNKILNKAKEMLENE